AQAQAQAQAGRVNICNVRDSLTSFKLIVHLAMVKAFLFKESFRDQLNNTHCSNVIGWLSKLIRLFLGLA
ncbi:hypothetical protein C5167_032913, partial [Papaver somniferum]